MVDDDLLLEISEKKQHEFLDAAKTGNWHEVKALLYETPTLVNCTPKRRWSALHQAAFLGAADAVKFLLEKKADASAVNRHGDTPYEIARGEKKLEVKKILEAVEGRPAETAKRPAGTSLVDDESSSETSEKSRQTPDERQQSPSKNEASQLSTVKVKMPKPKSIEMMVVLPRGAEFPVPLNMKDSATVLDAKELTASVFDINPFFFHISSGGKDVDAELTLGSCKHQDREGCFRVHVLEKTIFERPPEGTPCHILFSGEHAVYCEGFFGGWTQKLQIKIQRSGEVIQEVDFTFPAPDKLRFRDIDHTIAQSLPGQAQAADQHYDWIVQGVTAVHARKAAGPYPQEVGYFKQYAVVSVQEAEILNDAYATPRLLCKDCDGLTGWITP
eukprot:TRINITY_DN70272_c0_g1_i2.p1 TRINITY_DN70272_c0_g1~~TRINITY_DN70272_c0_g1_i2.p1  ORF type:complete len:387 (-),score=70.64 TRINITY_DN70272_c0_g1_i2:238-1398(-)